MTAGQDTRAVIAQRETDSMVENALRTLSEMGGTSEQLAEVKAVIQALHVQSQRHGMERDQARKLAEERARVLETVNHDLGETRGALNHASAEQEEFKKALSELQNKVKTFRDATHAEVSCRGKSSWPNAYNERSRALDDLLSSVP